ncbi:DsbA family protein [Roseospira goensis]|uniref:Protein-disulfide isomerase n=1 Tax=Roseospira goensis TaxID=391922 RepID=A0A7W6WM80_9PROT|nr:DsbA family protein [Roseospira goensis]MBB4287805.1 protein-disulfide isomerase [Roseospira goensis]
MTTRPPPHRSVWAGAVMAGLLALAWTGATPAQAQDPALSAAEEAAVRALVRDTLLANPEIIAEALEVYQEREAAAQAERSRAAIQQHRAALEAADAADVIGNPDGDVTVVEFSDYQCGYCKRVFPALMQAVEADGNVRLVIRELPILGPESVLAARAAEASRAQGRYPEFHTALMAMKGGVSEAAIMQVAAEVGLDVERLRADMADPALDQRFAENIQLARALGISGTPAFVIGDALVPGAVSQEELNDLIAAARAEG